LLSSCVLLLIRKHLLLNAQPDAAQQRVAGPTGVMGAQHGYANIAQRILMGEAIGRLLAFRALMNVKFLPEFTMDRGSSPAVTNKFYFVIAGLDPTLSGNPGQLAGADRRSTRRAICSRAPLPQVARQA